MPALPQAGHTYCSAPAICQHLKPLAIYLDLHRATILQQFVSITELTRTLQTPLIVVRCVHTTHQHLSWVITTDCSAQNQV